MRRITLVTLLAGLAAGAQAQVNYAAGSTAAPWLKLAPSARVAAMADAGSALSGEVESQNLNPAGLAGLGGTQLVLMHNLHVQDSFTDHVGLGFGLWEGAGLGLSGDYISFGAVDRYKVVNNALVKDGSVTPSGWAATLGFAQSMGGLSLGLNGRMVSQDLTGGSASSAFAGDLGLQYEMKAKDWSLGLAAAYLNLGTPLDGASLPQNLKLGARTSASVDAGTLSFLGDFNALAAAGSFDSGSVGAEFAGKSIYALRAGYKFLGNGGAAGLTLGAGLHFGGFQVDYAYVSRDSLGASNQISLAAKF